MRTVRKLFAAVAAAATIATVGATAAFASTDAIKPGDGTNGTYMTLDYGFGYAKTTNLTSTTRYCTAYVEARNYETEAELTNDYKYGNLDSKKTMEARVPDSYISSHFGYYWSGSILQGATSHAPALEVLSDKYPKYN